MVDTCQGSPTYDLEYAKRYYEVEFGAAIIPLPAAERHDTILVGLEAINPSYPTVKAAFSRFERANGKVTFRKVAPDVADTSVPLSQLFLVRFEQYGCVDSIVKQLKAIPYVHAASFVAP
jgi:hypothetical protein